MADIDEVKANMEKAVAAVRREFSAVRTGKATPALLDTVRVDVYGSRMPLNQVATVNAPEPRMLLVQPWDQNTLPDVEKAILAADLGLNPSNDGNVIRVPIPPLNQERREDLVRMLHKMAEEGRISVRHYRQEGNNEVKKQQQAGELSDDAAHRAMEQIQALTDASIDRIDKALAAKEEEVMEV